MSMKRLLIASAGLLALISACTCAKNADQPDAQGHHGHEHEPAQPGDQAAVGMSLQAPIAPLASPELAMFNAVTLPGPLNNFADRVGVPFGAVALAPRSVSELADMVAAARRLKVALRVRGNGFSLHLGSLPQAGEQLLITQHLDQFSLVDRGFVEAGAGMSINALQVYLLTRGLSLPVSDSSVDAGPSIGGYIAGGGLGWGRDSGGLGAWEMIERIDWVDGAGHLHRSDKTSPEFSMLFGSLGAFAVIANVRFRLHGQQHRPVTAEVSGRLSDHAQTIRFNSLRTNPQNFVYSFGLLAPAANVAAAQAFVQSLRDEYGSNDVLVNAGVIELPDRGQPYPPLLFAGNPPYAFVRLTVRVLAGEAEAILANIQSRIERFAGQNPQVRRYLALEAMPERQRLQAAFASQAGAVLGDYERRFDPDDILNRFAAP